MKYALYDNELKTNDIIKHVLWNRGIIDSDKYLNLTSDIVEDYNNLDNINVAVECFLNHFNNKDKITILVDCDPDGYTSAASMYLYIKQLDEDYLIEYIIHKSNKSHGLDQDVIDIVSNNETKLFIVPDAGTNDVEQCKCLNELGIDVIILDHHELEENNSNLVEQNLKGYNGFSTIIVNNQMSKNYLNKNLSGVGIVYRFLQALDEETWNEYADDYLDLVAFGNISDVMDMTSFETRYFTNEGIKNIKNKFLVAMINAQDYSMNSHVNIHNIQWYITPVCNAMLRVGDFEERDLLFRAFIEQDEFFEYNKKATKNKPAETIQESIYDRAARICKNAKSRQDRVRDKNVISISELVGENQNDNKVIIIDASDILDNKGLTGVLAIKIAEMYNKPCILLKKYIDENGNVVYGGSARNVDHSPIISFKDVVNNTGLMEGYGHNQAFGIVNFDINKLDEINETFNEMLKDIEYDSTYYVDYILQDYEVDISIPVAMEQFNDLLAQGIDEPMIAVENLTVHKSDLEVIGKNADTISFVFNDVKFIKFKCNKDIDELLKFYNESWNDNDYIKIDIVGKPGVNLYQGVKTPQITIEDFNVIEKHLSDENDEWDDNINNNDDNCDDDVPW